jgi:hypothetical protein
MRQLLIIAGQRFNNHELSRCFMTLSLPQKILYIFLLLLLVSVIFLSVRSLKDKGIDGYEACVQRKCEDKGEDFCQKAREQNNCCVGAGGVLGRNENGFICQF